jgi:hypothetical protein
MQLLNKNQMLDRLQKQREIFEPLTLNLIQEGISRTDLNKNLVIDGILEVEYEGKIIRLVLKLKNRTAPSIIENGIISLMQIKNLKKFSEYIPALYVPYLSVSIISRLKETNISGLDMNGNYYLISPELVAIRLDKKNDFKEQSPIKKIYSRNSSVVVRYLLKEKNVKNNLSFIAESIERRGFKLSFGTISKVLKSLEEELMILRNNGDIKVIQPEILLDKLVKGYQRPREIEKIYLKLPEDRSEAAITLNQIIGIGKWIWTGESSVSQYASTTPSTRFSIYALSDFVKDDLLDQYVDNKFYNYELYSTNDQYVFFDSENNYASNIQTYVELSYLDKREKEIAIDIKEDILDD